MIKEYSVHQRIAFGLFLFLKICGVLSADTVGCDGKKSFLNIAIIGGGASGLASAKHSIAQGHNVTVYEQNEELGGTWVYTDEVGKNKYGINIHTSMYKGLRTNGVYQLTEYPDLHYPNDTISFPPQSDVLKYLHSYADLFDLKKYIKFNHLVVRALPVKNDKWEVVVKDLPNDSFTTQIFDAIFVCNGHYFEPNIPNIEGAKEFNGKVIHSHDFRTAEAFRGIYTSNSFYPSAPLCFAESVILSQNSPSSGTKEARERLQLSLPRNTLVQGNVKRFHDDAAEFIDGTKVNVTAIIFATESVILSQNSPSSGTKEARERLQLSLPRNTLVQGNVKRFHDDAAEFIDGTKVNVTAIIFATGYKYSYPFMSVNSGIHVDNDDNFVQPLYKQIFNIEHPTMAFIGIPMSAINFYLFDLQARFALRFLSGEKKLPTKFDMLKDQKVETETIWNKGFLKRKTHFLVPVQREYFNQLSTLAETGNIPEVLDAIAMASLIC